MERSSLSEHSFPFPATNIMNVCEGWAWGFSRRPHHRACPAGAGLPAGHGSGGGRGWPHPVPLFSGLGTALLLPLLPFSSPPSVHLPPSSSPSSPPPPPLLPLLFPSSPEARQTLTVWGMLPSSWSGGTSASRRSCFPRRVSVPACGVTDVHLCVLNPRGLGHGRRIPGSSGEVWGQLHPRSHQDCLGNSS